MKGNSSRKKSFLSHQYYTPLHKEDFMRTTKKILLFLLLSITVGLAIGQTTPVVFIDPTGSYRMRLNMHKEGEDAYGYYGDMRVKMLTPTKIVIDWDVNKGAPSYSGGGINDTLVYHSNKAVFKTPEDSTCKIEFQFFKNKVIVKEKTADYNSGCGFGHGVDGNGIYKKISRRVPEISPRQ